MQADIGPDVLVTGGDGPIESQYRPGRNDIGQALIGCHFISQLLFHAEMAGNDRPDEAVSGQAVAAALAAVAGPGNLDQGHITGMSFLTITVVKGLKQPVRRPEAGMTADSQGHIIADETRRFHRRNKLCHNDLPFVW